MNRDCKIIQDLLPNYIDKLTTKESNAYIEEHLKECEECRKNLEDMEKELKLDTDKKDGKKVKYMKKFSNKMRILKLILFVILIIFLISTGRKMLILANLSKKAEEYVNSTNYHRITYGYQPDYYIKTEVYTLGTKQAVLTTQFVNGEKKEVKIYGESGKINSIYTDYQGKKTVNLNMNGEMTVNIPNETYLDDNVWLLFLAAVTSSINNRTVNGKECYYISNIYDFYVYATAGDGRYIDKENGLTIKSNANEDGTWPQADYIYEFNIVTEEDFKQPNINEYEVQN